MSSTLLAKIGEGIPIGVAAGITIGAILYLETRWAMSEIEASSFDIPGFKSYGPDANLSIRSHRPKAPGANTAFIGEVANAGSDSWDFGPGQVRNFEVSCSNCRDSAVPAYDRYTIEIVDANFEQVRNASR